MKPNRVLYSAYPGLGRTAMWRGFPLIPALIVVGASVLIAVAGGLVFGPGGLLFGLPGVPVLFFFKEICRTDDQALRILGLELLCVLARRNTHCFGGTYTLLPMRYCRQVEDIRAGVGQSSRAQQRFTALQRWVTGGAY